VDKAAEVVASPVTATWVRTKWGDSYLERENVFYRMLLILGLSSYETITGDPRHHALMSAQRAGLAQELAAAPRHLLDDYPGECYPNDILWAVAAIQRAARLDNTNHADLARALMADFDGPVRAPQGLPACQMDARTGRIIQNARGCVSSGILMFAGELDPVIADKWYHAYETHFWKDNGWIAGFSEMPRGTCPEFMDVDSGPVIFDFGSVASAFGIGAAKAAGRLDHAVPLTLEAVACSWPTPFGFLIPGFLGRVAAEGSCLGEIALLFSMTRPLRGLEVVPFSGRIPGCVWADDLPRGGDGIDEVHRVVPPQPPGHRCAGGRHDGGIQPVEIERDEDPLRESLRNPVLRQLPGGNRVGIVRGNGLPVRRAVAGFFLAVGAGAKLDDRKPQLVHAAHDAGVGVLRPFVGVAQIGVGVEMDEPDVRAGRLERARRRLGHRVLAAEHHRHRAAAQGLGDGRFDGIDPTLLQAFLASGRFHHRLRMDAKVAGTTAPVEVFQLSGGFEDGARPLGRAAAVRDRRLHRRGNDVEERLRRRRVRISAVEKRRCFHTHNLERKSA
jgi:hypothetical protein